MRKTMPAVKITLLTSVLSLFLLSSHAQVLQEVQNSFNLYKQTSLQEKIYAHTDKTIYLPGEILWFKIYCVDGNDHKPLNLSKVAYVELLDENQNPVIQAKIPMKKGVGNGSLYIPVSVNNGNYKLRVYTNWMKNFSPDFYFEKMITLINPLKSPDITKAITANYDVQFFPEGGNLVTGIASKVAFKAMAPNGKGVSVKGAIVDQRNDTVVRFNSLKFGMGNFSFTPAANSTYKAVMLVDGKPVTKDLPQVNAQGYVMNLTDNGSGQLDVTLTGNGNEVGNVYLVANTRQDIKATQNVIMANGKAHFTISKSALGDGISHLTIFDNAKQPICERLYFKRPARQLAIDASADQQQYNLRKKVSVNVLAKDKAGKSLDAEMSIAVYRVDSIQKVDNMDIFNYLWLSSELKGGIESAEYYFKNANAETDEALDNLMLTQGWRRFKWSQVLANKTPEFAYLPEYYGHLINAKIVNSETGAPARNITTFLGIPGKRVQLYTSVSDTAGHLGYYTKDFFGPNEIIAQTNQLVDSVYRIDIASPFSEQFSKTILPRFDFSAATIPALKAHSLGIQILNIYSGNNIKRFYDPKVDSSAFYGKPFASYKLDDFTRFTTMEEDLREYVKEDNIIKIKGNFHIKVLSDRGFLDAGDPLVLVDGIPVFNINKIFTIDPLKVRRLEVMPYIYFYGPVTEGGIFSFTTYKGDLGGVELDPRAVVIDYEGMQLRREFYSPVYNTPDDIASRIPDFRNLLYWSPTVTSGTPVSFYTSDQPGKYVGVVQGLSANGDAGSQTFSFEVK